jgi:CRISPR-associated endonuclease Csn1
MTEQGVGEFVLGIDLGSNSLGWAMVGLVDGEPANLIRAGVRVFDAGMEGDIESGQEQSKNLKRREARLHRRQLWRRARRLTKTFNLLRQFGLLPTGDASTPEKRQDLINDLDKLIRSSDWFKAKASTGKYPEPQQTLPYILRAVALDEPLEPRFLGRALYHLAQRRGFLSNRLKPAKQQDDEGAVKKGISELRKAIEETRARTLGEYFARVSPTQRRIRSRWTARSMYEEEFESIWTAQAPHHPTLLTDERKKGLRQILFFQRPLWFDPNVIGGCELEAEERRAPAYLLPAQRFRLLQTVNNLKVLPPGQPERDLSGVERKKVIDALELKGDQTFVQIRKLLSLKGCEFNLERGGEKRIKGNRTSADFCGAFGERWLEMTPVERDRAVEYVHAFQRPDKVAPAAKKAWHLGDEAAEKLGEISLEPEYLNLSRRAIERLMPLLEQGVSYATARRQLYPERFEARKPLASLPPVEQALSEIRNPAVKRSLTEVRKVVNAVVRAYGKPTQIRIELARELKKSKKQRQALSDAMRKNEKARAEAARRIIAEAGVAEPKPDDMRKFLLAEECRWQCPYTGRTISMQGLFGPEPQFDIEHIVPFDRSLDNSFTNLTLCYHEENRNVKRGRTPFQSYGGSERYDQILDRVSRFTGERRMAAAKLRRFKLNDEELELFLADFRNRQLNDTAYASSLAAGYLGLLYGGLTDAGGDRRIQASSGQTTAYFRSLWKLNSVLDDGPSTHGGRAAKSRFDHRHHAVDAVVIGLTDAAMVKRLSDAAQRAPFTGRKHFASLEAPWPNFVDSVRQEIDRVVVSHRASKKVSGALHEETIYSRPLPDGASRVRKPLAALTKSEVEDTADPQVRRIIQKKLAEIGIDDPKKAFSDESKLPFFQARDGRRVPVRRVRIKKALPTSPLGDGRTVRHVASESNHHVEVYAEIDEKGNEGEWDGDVVSMFEAYQRQKARKPVVQRDHGPVVSFKFSLAPGEVIECDGKTRGRSLFVMRKASRLSSGQLQIGFAPINDARKAKEMQTSRAWLWATPDTLSQRHPRKVMVNALGEVSEAHD